MFLEVVFPVQIGLGNPVCIMPFLTVHSTLKLVSSSGKSWMRMFSSPHQTPISVTQLGFMGCKQHILANMTRDGELLGRNVGSLQNRSRN